MLFASRVVVFWLAVLDKRQAYKLTSALCHHWRYWYITINTVCLLCDTYTYSKERFEPAILLLTRTLTYPWPLTFQPQNHVACIGYPKVIPYAKFEHLGSFVFELCCGQTNWQTNRRTWTSYPRRSTEIAWVMTDDEWNRYTIGRAQIKPEVINFSARYKNIHTTRIAHHIPDTVYGFRKTYSMSVELQRSCRYFQHRSYRAVDMSGAMEGEI